MNNEQGFSLIVIMIAVTIAVILAISLRDKTDYTVGPDVDTTSTYKKPSINNRGSITAPIKKAEDIMDILKQRDRNFLSF